MIPHLSYSRVQAYADCPRAYHARYVLRLPEPPSVPLQLGSAVHAALEAAAMQMVRNGASGAIDGAPHIDAALAGAGCTDLQAQADAREMVRRYAIQSAEAPAEIVGIEAGFELKELRWPLIGYIDRMDLIAPRTIRVVDYKTSRQLYTREELDTSLQISIYAAAVAQKYPGYDIQLEYHMLRHGVVQRTTRSQRERDDALAYCSVIGSMIERDEKWEPRLNSHCSYCSVQSTCPAINSQLNEIDMSSLEAVAIERERLAMICKTLYARKAELEGVIKSALRDVESISAAGKTYRMIKTESRDYPLGAVADYLSMRTGIPAVELRHSLSAVDVDAMKDAIREHAPRGKIAIWQAEIDSLATVTYGRRLEAR